MKVILKFVLIKLIQFYQAFISPLLGAKCRYIPTCSEYGKEAINKYGLLKGLKYFIKRFKTCHPWGGHGYDPLP